MALAPLRIVEGDEPLLTFQVTRFVSGSEQAVDITGAAVSFIKKADEYTADSSGTSIAGTITDAANGTFTVQITSAITSAAGKYFYKALVTTSSRPLTVRHGTLIIENA